MLGAGLVPGKGTATPKPNAVSERLIRIWAGPQGAVLAALAGKDSTKVSVEGGKAVQISMTVDDPGAFTTPWSATPRWRRVERRALSESPCNENNANYFEKFSVPTPTVV